MHWKQEPMFKMSKTRRPDMIQFCCHMLSLGLIIPVPRMWKHQVPRQCKANRGGVAHGSAAQRPMETLLLWTNASGAGEVKTPLLPVALVSARCAGSGPLSLVGKRGGCSGGVRGGSMVVVLGEWQIGTYRAASPRCSSGSLCRAVAPVGGRSPERSPGGAAC